MRSSAFITLYLAALAAASYSKCCVEDCSGYCIPHPSQRRGISVEAGPVKVDVGDGQIVDVEAPGADVRVGKRSSGSGSGRSKARRDLIDAGVDAHVGPVGLDVGVAVGKKKARRGAAGSGVVCPSSHPVVCVAVERRA